MRCDQCRFWERCDKPRHFIGKCRKHPPQLNVSLLQSLQDFLCRELGETEISDLPVVWLFPATIANDWCGEFQPKEP
jgi:hypothetical protein